MKTYEEARDSLRINANLRSNGILERYRDIIRQVADDPCILEYALRGLRGRKFDIALLLKNQRTGDRRPGEPHHRRGADRHRDRYGDGEGRLMPTMDEMANAIGVCEFCNQVSTLLCDGKMPDGRTCDKKVCRRCAKPVAFLRIKRARGCGSDTRDLCPDCVAAGREAL